MSSGCAAMSSGREAIQDHCLLRVADPGYRGRTLVVHGCLGHMEAQELLAVYGALGYGEDMLEVQRQDSEAVA
mgnify:CR=1 FL=1